jgi:ADP-ribosyl-[dinitrogen reductase] hydrolase
MLYPNPKMLLYIGAADAYAAAAEFVGRDRSDITDACLRFEGYVAHPTHGQVVGRYTDDTEMSVANAKTIVSHPFPYSLKDFADAYVAEFVFGGRRKGYAKGFQAFLEKVTSGRQFLAEIRPTSDKNGAAMRAVPFGAIPDIWAVLYGATLQAMVTHNTPAGIFSSRAVALMSHYALYESGPLDRLDEYCLHHLPLGDCRNFGHIFVSRRPDGPIEWRGKKSVAVDTVHSVVELLRREKTLMGMLRLAIEWGGDTDSVAAIAWGIASTRLLDEELPEFLFRDLEGGDPRTGAPYLERVGADLMAAFAE